ncbi:hypothetical protein [Aliiroseovarius sp. YM-037]|uniref:hypothetical protein n=1 Tax=Aliiroseovarius sp. YM-037 TaxID=3341728 RepID=UPI003A7F99AD
MDRLAIVLAVISGSSIAGAAVIAALALGYYSWVSIAICVAIGAIFAWPTGRMISRRIKRNDPEWNPRHKPGDFGVVPPADAPEN